MSRRGAPRAPYTTGYINTEELHFVKRVLNRESGEASSRWEMECGRIGPVRYRLTSAAGAATLATQGDVSHPFLVRGCLGIHALD